MIKPPKSKEKIRKRTKKAYRKRKHAKRQHLLLLLMPSCFTWQVQQRDHIRNETSHH